MFSVLAPTVPLVPQVVSLKSDWAKGYSRKGAALHHMKRYTEAVEAYTQVAS